MFHVACAMVTYRSLRDSNLTKFQKDKDGTFIRIFVIVYHIVYFWTHWGTAMNSVVQIPKYDRATKRTDGPMKQGSAANNKISCFTQGSHSPWDILGEWGSFFSYGKVAFYNFQTWAKQSLYFATLRKCVEARVKITRMPFSRRSTSCLPR